MKTNRRKIIGVAAATALAALAGTAVLAHGGGYGPGAGAGYGQMMGGHGPGANHGQMMGGYGRDGRRGSMMGDARGMGFGDPGAFAEQRLADFRAQLAITADQESAWNAFAEALHAQAATMQARRELMAGGEGQGFTERFAHMQARAEQMGAVAEAASGLYEALTPEQQARADSLTAGGCWQ